MKTTLVMSSFVAASRVGASASTFCLRRLGIETVTLPTTLLGRHPGWGDPGGESVDTDVLRGMWNGIKTQQIEFDAILTGYMAKPPQIDLAVDIISDIKAANKNAIILVDPVMGDNGRLYVKDEVAESIKTQLLPLAKIITPNVWELEYLTGSALPGRDSIFRAAQDLHNGTLVTSVPARGNIGAAFIHDHVAAMVSHRRFEAIPHGGGDALAATFLGHVLNGQRPESALAKSVAGIFDIISTAVARDAGELPLVRRQAALVEAKPLPIERHRL